MFSNSSFNALLKTLEEPPPHVKFLLATTEPKKLPVTVLSRCLQFNLKRLNLTQIKDHLIKLLKLQNVEFDESAIELIARAADGSMRDGLSLLDQSLAYGAGKVLEKDIKLMLGTMDQDTVVSLLDSIIAKDSASLTNTLSQIFDMSPDYSRFLQDMALLLHEVSLVQILNKFVDNSQFDRTRVKNIVQNTSPEQIQLYYQIVIKGQEEISLAPDSKTGFEMTIIRLFAFQIGQPPEGQKQQKVQNTSIDNTPIQAHQTPENQNVSIDSTPAQAQQTSESQNVSIDNTPAQVKPITEIQETKHQYSQNLQENSLTLSDLSESNWVNVFEKLNLKGMARELARNAHVINNKDNKLVLAIDNQASAFMTESAIDQLKSALLNLSSDEISIKLEMEDNLSKTIAKNEQAEQDNSKRETIDKVEQNPFVKHMQENFDAEVIQIKKGESFI